MIKINMDKAREIHRNYMRAARAELMPALDVDFQRAQEANDSNKIKEIATKKQNLRDVTADPLIDAGKTPEELKAVWPKVLGK